MMSFSNLFQYFILLTLATCSKSIQPIPGHAHNDYEHESPLMEAIENGFISIEADIYLIEDELYVSHEYPSNLNPERTLETLYLNPLKELITRNKGSIYKHYSEPIYLFVDVKSEANATYEKLKEICNSYSDLLTFSEDNHLIQRQIMVVLSGNRAIDKILKEDHKLIFIDGRPSDLDKDIPSIFMPVVSENYNKILTWDGLEDLNPQEKENFIDLANKCALEGTKLRLWASPENEKVWSFLLANGANLINTDKLREFKEFMMR